MPTAPSRAAVPPRLPTGVRRVWDEVVEGDVPVARHPGWAERFPWLVQGVTTRGKEGEALNFSVASGRSVATRARWRRLLYQTGTGRAVLGGQVHGAGVRLHAEGAPGVELVPDIDGHVTGRPGVLLGVTVADCVPVFLVAGGGVGGGVDGRPATSGGGRAVAALHAGWRGTAAGILEAGLRTLREGPGVLPAELHVHLGPAICGGCYEVGPEVHEALGLPVPDRPTPVDLRSVLAGRVVAAGVPADRVSVSTWCTRCGDSPFFSHRGGDPERQVGFVGIRR